MKKFYIKQLMLLFLAFALLTGIHSQECMNVYSKSQGLFLSMNLDEIDKITFPSEDEAEILARSGIVTPIAIENIEVITFGERIVTAVEQTKSEAEIEVIYFSGRGEVRINSMEVITRVQLFNAQGVLMQTKIPQAETTTLDVSSYPKGLYIVFVQSGNRIVAEKIMK